MGPCLSNKSGQNIDTQQHFQRDKTNDDKTTQPLFSTLYNILRKGRDLQIINRNPTKQYFQNETDPQLSELTVSDLKMLYNFKTILWIGSVSQQLKHVQEHTNPKNLYVISRQYCQKFITKFPIFSPQQSNKLKVMEIPLLVFNSSQLIKQKQKLNSNKTIYLHSSKHRNDRIYKALDIKQIIDDSDRQGQGGDDKFIKKLTHSHNKNVLYLHDPAMQQSQLLNILTQVVMAQYKTNQLSAKIYLKRFLPNTQLLDTNTSKNNSFAAIKMPSPRNQKKEEMSLEEQQTRLLHKLYQEIGGSQALNKLQRAYNLLVTLLTNIYSNRDSQNYRKVKKTNKQINEMLGKYKYGVQLLKISGFEDSQGFYSNNLDQKYLKIYRTDLDLAYRHFLENKDNY